MPMLPSPAAAAIYRAIKFAGYSYFAVGLNRIVRGSIPPITFGFAKTAIGLVGGFSYLFAVVHAISGGLSDSATYLGAIPVRRCVDRDAVDLLWLQA